MGSRTLAAFCQGRDICHQESRIMEASETITVEANPCGTVVPDVKGVEQSVSGRSCELGNYDWCE